MKFYKIFLIFNLIITLVVFYYVTLNREFKTSFSNFKLLRNNYTNINNKKFYNLTIFCLIKTKPDSLLDSKAEIVLKVWAHRCDNYRFISVIPKELKLKNNLSLITTNKSIEIDYPFNILQPEGIVEEAYRKLTSKVYSALKHVYKYFSNYDWYLIVDDDSYIHFNNLKQFLSTKNKTYPVTYGHDFKISVEYGYHSGGCGYVLSNEALLRIGYVLTYNETYCSNTGLEDVDVASCLRKLKVYPNKSIDEFNRERFLPINLITAYLGPVQGWLISYSANPPRIGLNCCSDSLIGVHYMNSKELIKLDNTFSKLENDKNDKILFKNVIEDYLKE